MSNTTCTNETTRSEMDLFYLQACLINGSTTEEKTNDCILDLVQKQIQQHPNNVAINAWDGDLTYAQVAIGTNEIATRLGRLGYSHYVAICVPRTKWTPVAMLAALQTGAAFVHLDPAYPSSRISAICAACNITTAICLEGTADVLETHIERIVIIKDDYLTQTTSTLPVLGGTNVPSDTSYVVFTSGSSGTPKGVVVPHSAICTSIVAQGLEFQLSTTTRVLQFAPATFDASMFELITTLCFGSCVCIPSQFEREHDPAAVLNKYRTDIVFLTPSVARTVDPDTVPLLKTLIVGGEAPDQALIDTWLSRGRRISNVYGPSECAVSAAVLHYDAQRRVPAATIGRPFGGGLWVADPDNHNMLVRPGEIGELLISGHIVTDGYLGDPIKTSASFVHSPDWWKDAASGRSYKTGDLVKYDTDGLVLYVGRKDSQVKVRGQRLELGEVEHHLHQSASVGEAMACVPRNGLYNGHLTAVLTLRVLSGPEDAVANTIEPVTSVPDLSVAQETLTVQRALESSLPPYMVPTQWLVLRSMPRSASDKLDVRRIQAWIEAADPELLDSSRKDVQLPTTVSEEILLASWKRVLKDATLGTMDQFIRRGGDSILAMQVIAECRKHDLKVSVRSLLAPQSLADIAREASMSSIKAFQQEEEKIGEPFELSPIQKLYFESDPSGENMCNQSISLSLKGGLKLEALHRALTAIVTRHSMLRARFLRDHALHWTQHVTMDVDRSFSLREHHLASEIQKATYIEESEHSIDIRHGPMLTADVFELNGQHTMHLAAHHLVVDFVSWRIILDDIDAVLSGDSQSLCRTEPLPFSQWTKLQAEYAQALPSPATDNEHISYAFWEFSEEENTVSNSTEASFELDMATSNAILGPCNTAVASEPVDLLVAAILYSFNQTFSTERHAPQVYVEGHGREPWDDSLDISGTVGWFTTMFPIKLEHSYLEDDIVALVRGVSIARRSSTHGRLDHFTLRYLTRAGQVRSAQSSCKEILFNFGGSFSTTSQDDSSSHFDFASGSNGLPFDERRTGKRIALFEITSIVKDGQFVFNFQFPRVLRRGEQVLRWFQTCRDTLLRIARELPSRPRQLHVTEFALLDIPYSLSDTYMSSVSDQLNLEELAMIEDIYPCSAIQSGMLVSQSQQSHLYQLFITWEITATPGCSVDVRTFLRAWQQVVDENTILRTVFVEDTVGRDAFHLVILRVGFVTAWMQELTQDENMELLARPTYSRAQPHHRLTVQRFSDDGLRCRLDINHALVDGSSLALVVDQVQRAYASLPKTKCLAYREYIGYHQAQITQNAAHLAYWQKYLANATPCLFPALAAPSSTSLTTSRLEGLKTVHFDIIDRARIQSFCQRHNVTISSVFQLAWALCLRAFTNQTSISFGYLVSHRDLPLDGIETAVGPYINTIVRRIELDNDSSSIGLLHHLQDDLTEGLEHGLSSLSDVLRNSALSNRSGLFNTSISYQRYVTDTTAPHELLFSRKALFDPSEDVVALDVDDYGTHIDPFLSYWQSLLSDKHAQSLADTVAIAVAKLVRGQETSLNQLSIVPQHHVREMKRLNANAPSSNQCLHDMVSRQAQSVPGAIAVQSRDGNFTYTQIDELSSRLAHYLIGTQRIDLEERILFCSEKTALAVIILLGILKAGGACVAVDPAQPMMRLQHIAKETDAKLIFASTSTSSRLSGLAVPTVIFSAEFLCALPKEPSAVPSRKVRPNNLAVIVYTSGSTGLPKGIMLEHGSLCASILAHASALRIDKTTRALQFASWSFDVSIEETFTTLSQGGCVCVPSEWDRKNDLAAFIRDFRVNWVDLVPGMARQMQPESIPSVKTMILGGERLPVDVARRWANRVQLINVYGPAECSINATYDDNLSTTSDGSTIGRVLPCTRAWVVSTTNHNVLMPIGGIGELVLSGPTVMRGYINDETRTAAATFTHPAWSVPHLAAERFYKTGDLVRLGSNGELFLLGRKDAQRKLRGHRIDLEEIQQVISDSSQVRTCLVALPRSGPFKDQIVAVVVLDLVTRPDEEAHLHLLPTERLERVRPRLNDVRSWISARLPALMVPTAWAVVASIPELASGKLNTSLVSRWLTELNDATTQAIQDTLRETEVQLPTSEKESSLLGIWATVLNRPAEAIGVNQSFLSMGGDSMAAMQIRSRAKNIGLAISVENLLSGLTIADIARDAGIVAAGEPTIPRGDDSDTEQQPSAIQKTYLSSSTPTSLKRFNLATLLKPSQSVSGDRFRMALLSIVTRHSALRTRFIYRDGNWYQQSDVSPELAVMFMTTKVTDEQDLDGAIEHAQGQVDVLNGPGLVGCILAHQSGEDMLFLTAHHLLVDIVSWQIIIDEMQEALQNSTNVSTLPLPYSSWCKHVRAENLINDANLDKWSMVSPAAAMRERNVYGDVVEMSLRLEPETTSALLALCQNTSRIELVELLLTAVITGYQHASDGQPLTRVLNEDHGRHSSHQDFDPYGTVGWFTSMSPIFSDKTDIQGILQQVKTSRRNFCGRRWLAGYMQRATNHDEAVATLENAEVLFNYIGKQQHGTPSAHQIFSRIENKHVQSSSVAPDLVRPARYEFLAMVQDGELQIDLGYNKTLDDECRMEGWCSHIRQALVDLIKLPAAQLECLTIADCKLISVGEASFEQILARVSETAYVTGSAIEDIIPCHPVQEGMLVSQARDPSQYMTSSTWEVTTKDGTMVDADRFSNAWKTVVNNHDILRTFFAEETVRAGSLFAQVILKEITPRVVVLPPVKSYDLALLAVEAFPSIKASDQPPLHQLVICQGGTRTVCRLDISHTIIDGASMHLLVEQLATAYEGSKSDILTRSTYHPLIRHWLETMPDENAEQSLRFWQNHLSGVEPCYFPKLAPTTTDQSVHLMPIELASTEKFRKMSKAYGLTPFNVIQIAWSLVLRAFTGTDTVCFGYLTSGRHRPISHIEDAIGPYFTLLVCKTTFDPSSVLLDSLRKAQTTFLESFDHQEVSLSSIQHALGLRDGMGLFNTLLTYQASTDLEKSQQLIGFNEISSYDPTEFDITLGVMDSPSGMKVGMEYTQSCLTVQQARLIADAVTQAIDNIIRDPLQAVSEVALVGPAQRQLILDANAAPPLIIDELLHEEISRLAVISPDAMAVRSWDGSLTRGKLDQLSSNLVAHLSSERIIEKPGQIVPLCFNKSIWAIVSVLAVLKAGGAVAFMAPDASPEQMREMAKIADASTVLGDADMVSTIKAAGLQCLPVTSSLLSSYLPTPPRTPTERIESTDASFVVFTSGSTGTPKAVVHTHGSIAATAYSERSLGINTPETHRLQFAGYSFDVAVTDIISTLRAGGCICIPSEHERIHELAATIEKLGANAANLTPTVVRTLKPEEIPCMKSLLVGGEALSRDIIQTWSPYVTLINSYGPAESGINGVCKFDVNVDRAADIGKPFPTMRIWLVDSANLNLLAPVGAIGEIILEGSGVAREYLKDLERSALAFPSPPTWYQALPSSIKSQGRLYATGDLARYTADGTVEFLGRKNQETKLHGHRIDLQVVEDGVSAALDDNSLLVAAEVVAIDNLGKRLIAFVSSRNHVHNISNVVTIDDDTEGHFSGQRWSDLRQQMKPILSKHSIPTAIVPLGSMPLTQSRKIHRRALREMSLESFMQSDRLGTKSYTDKRMPMSEHERLLQELWAKAIGIDSELIGLDDHFLDMGGDSVAAMALAGLARDAGLSLKTSLVFQHVTLEGMATSLTISRQDGAITPFSLLSVDHGNFQSVIASAASACNVTEDHIEDLYPSTPLQEGLLALSGSEQNAYISTETIQLTPAIEIDRLERAFNRVAQAEPILRTRLAFVEGFGTLQVVIKESIVFANVDTTPTMGNGRPLVWFGLSQDKARLTWVMHHAIYDGFSRKLLLEKIQACYEDELAALSSSALYSMYVAYTSDPSIYDAAKTYWMDRLVDAAIPTFPRSASSKQNVKPWTNAVIERSLTLPRTSHGITTATLVQTAWAMTVAQHSDNSTDDVVFGMTVSGREAPVPSLDLVTGPCIATVPSRVHLPKDAKAMHVLHTVQDDNLAMMPHAHVGLQDIAKSLPKEAAHVCEFKSLLVIQPAQLKELGATALSFGTLMEEDPNVEAHPFAIVAECGLASDSLELYIMFDDRIIDATELGWILTHFDEAVQSLGKVLIGDDNLSTISSLKSNSPAEISIIQGWNGPHPEVVDSCLQDLFLDTVARQPNAIAVDSHEGSWTYRELDNISTVLAHELQRRGVQPESMVSVCFGKTFWAVASILAIWKAGGAYVPLDPLQPVQRLHGLINQAKSKLVLTGSSAIAMELTEASIMPDTAVVDTTFLNELATQYGTKGVVSNIATPTNTCFVLFTSGSTGQPKGVVMTHRTIATSIGVQTNSTHMEPTSRVLHYSSLTFDMSVLELYGTLTLGGCICIPSDDERLSDIGGFMARQGVSWAFMTPTTANAIPHPPASLQTLVLGGEPVTQDIPARWPSNVDVLSGYGPTEVSIVCAMVDIRRDPLPAGLIGPSTGGKMWLVESGNVERVVGLGEVGEIMVSSVMLSEGYFADEQRTRAAFKPRPTWLAQLMPDGPERVYMTGDLAVHLPNGELVSLGRADSQVKINGQRIELGEVEQQLIASGCAAGDAVVEVCKIQAWEDKKMLVAFIQIGNTSNSKSAEIFINSEPATRQTIQTLRKAAATRLPRSWTPTLFVPIEAFPRSVSGKTDRKALRAMIQASAVDQLLALMSSIKGTHVQVSTQNELLLQGMWSSVLNIATSQLSANDMFTDVGGDSVAAIRLSALALQQGWTLRVADILLHSSLQAMAEAMKPAERNTKAALAPFALLSSTTHIRELAGLAGLEPKIIEDAYPCTPLQEGIMAISQSRPGTYIGSFVYKVHPRVTSEALQIAWNAVVARYPILRTRIIAMDVCNYVQVVRKHEALSVPVIALGDLKSEQERQRKSMVLGNDLVFVMVAESGLDRYLSLTIHHSIYDGWSLPLLMEDLEEAVHSGSIPLTPPGRFNEFVAYIQHEKQSSEDFWKAQLEEAQPVDYPTQLNRNYKPQTDSISISKLQIPVQRPHSAVTTPLMLRSAWAMVLSRYTATDDVLFGVVHSGRNAPVAGIDRLPAPTFTTIPIRMRLQDTSTLETLFGRVREQSIAMIPHEQLGLRAISQQFNKDYGIPLTFNNLLLVQTSESTVVDRKDRLLEADESLSHTMSESYGLVIECVLGTNDEQNVTIHVHYDSRLLSEEAVSWLMRHFQEAIRWVCTAPTTSLLADFDMTSEADKMAVKQWNQPCPSREDSCIHWTIQQEAKTRPNAIALDATVGGQWTYQGLDQASSRLALHLISLGVELGSNIPVMFEKGAWAIVAMLAVLKAGGAYVPLDSKDAVERHQYILHQSRATVALTANADALSEHGLRCIAVNASEMEMWPTCTTFAISAQPHNAAYILFTSGSTGVPKGVVMDHSSLATAAAAMRTRFDLGPQCRVYNFSSFTFDVSILDIFIALSSGATVCLPSDSERLDDLSGSLRRFRASFAFLTPTMASLVDHDAAAGMDTIILGGEAVTEDALAHCSGAKNILAGYGPTETCILSASGSLREFSGSCIGRPLGGQLWIIDPSSSPEQPRLAAIGCEGELVISGNTLARCYLGDAEKTAAAFIENVEWLSDQPTRRLYRTGDRVRFQPDGSVMFLGRMDAQIKHNGRRLELGEIEYHVAATRQLEHAIISYPQRGPWKKTITAVVELTELADDHLDCSPAQRKTLDSVLLAPNHQISTALADVRSELAAKLPAYMMPQAWVVIRKMPRGSAAKIDRAQISRWVNDASEESYEVSQYPASDQIFTSRALTSLEEQIRSLWASVLNRPVASIAVDVPFPQFSGDSVSAIQVASKAKRAGLSITAQDVMRSQTIERLALVAEEAGSRAIDCVQTTTTTTRPKFVENGQSFPLSPIQHMYFKHIAAFEDRATEQESHFNQSFLLQLSPSISQDRLEAAVRSLTEQNAMLRVRFHQGSDGKITQAISPDIGGSYRYYDLGESTVNQANETIAIKQRELHPITGPIFFTISMQIDGIRLLFLSALHLVVDLVSWRVIAQQLKQLLEGEKLIASPNSTSFHEWTDLQDEQGKISDTAIPLSQAADLNFWGVTGQETTYGHISQASFSLDNVTSTLLLSQSNKALASETIDTLTASLAMAFAQTFPERTVPTIHIEGHGREAWDNSLDIGQTVGWFTTMYPCAIDVDAIISTVAAVRAAKDFRVRTPGRGRPYFSSLYNSRSDRHDEPHQMEILLNYAGGYGEIEGENIDALLRMPDEALASQIDNHCIGKNIRRHALVEIYAALNCGKLELSFTWSSHMQHQSRIQHWVEFVHATLQSMARDLVEIPEQPTLSDLELFEGGHENLDAIIGKASVLASGSTSADIEDIYAATTLQTKMINARRSGVQLFNVKQAYQFHLMGSVKQVASHLTSAWQQVQQRHATLRSVIVEDNRKRMYNVVFKQTNSRMNTSWVRNDEIEKRLTEPSCDGPVLPTLQLLLEEGNDTAHVLLQISHTKCDASSLAVIMDDLQAAYHGTLARSSRSSMVHKKLSAHHQMSTNESHASTKYWQNLLVNAKPTNLVAAAKPHRGMYTSEDLIVTYTPALRTLGERHGATLATTLQAAWTLTLRTLLDQDDITFGYFSSGRDQPIPGIDSAVGLFMNLCASRTHLDAGTTVSSLLRSIQEDFSMGLQHQSACLHIVERMERDAQEPLFNTAFNFPKSSATIIDSTGGEINDKQEIIVFEPVAGTDPMDFAILVRVRDVQDEGISVALEYWPERTEAELVKRAGEVFVKAVQWIARAEGGEEVWVINYVWRRVDLG
ncbi:acetyl-CoA synthetase-like protein [Setomelanomma holmii]|uniref:Acetyl-CoA synthetase-like protein n=1 Tax=Setomelanomma holmii TaxID=210430 RepID=A0A9P4HBS5_9PLEO|nr:acetyl-CoA synthetase-like protein [Setomelanomma holmii]